MTRRFSNAGRLVAAAVCGALAVVGWQRLVPSQAVHAVATDGLDTFAVATGPIEEDLEAFYFVDFLTGELKGAALNTQSGQFTTMFAPRNLMADLGLPQTLRNPKYSIVTGLARMVNRGSLLRPGISVIYITEETTGATAAYAVPVVPNVRQRGQPPTAFVLLDTFRFRNVVVRE